MDVRIDGRVALVTGGSKGIGFAIASQFAASGADVVLVAREQSALDKAAATIRERTGRQAVAISSDIASAEGVTRAYETAMAALGRIDILVNNAGISRAMPFMQITDEAWQADFDLKLFAAIRFARLIFPQMTERRWGRIINVLNIGAKAQRPASAPTSVSRAAGMAVTKILSGEGAPHNVLVNALLVGRIESDQWVRAAAREGISTEEYLAKTGKQIPLGRVGTAEEFANVACFLASDAGGYVTGTAINVDGGSSPVV